MATIADVSAAGDIRRAAEALLARYPSAPASETETAIAVLALWALGAVEGGHLTPADADRVFTMLDVRLGEVAGDPELSDAVSDLILEGEHFHHWGDEWGPDAGDLRRLAFAILTDARSSDTHVESEIPRANRTSSVPQGDGLAAVVRIFRKRTGSDSWHLCRNCSTWPTSNYHEQVDRPASGEYCNECLAKRRNGNCR